MSLVKDFRDFFDGFFGGATGNDGGGMFARMGPSEAGMEVNETSAMTVGAVAACQRIISSAVASLGCYIHERLPEDAGSKLAEDHEFWDMLSLRPNPEYPAVDFYSAGQINLLQNGNAYAEILRNGKGRPAELQLLSPFRTQPYRDSRTGAIFYRTSDTLNGEQRVIQIENMIHVKGMGINPYVGLSPIRMYMREVIGTALAAQAYGARLFKNGSRPGGYLKSSATVNKDKKLEQIQSWIAGHAGANSHMPAYLDGGVEWTNVGIAPDEAQFLQTRQFQRSEIASIYGVPAHMLGDPQETKATIEQKALEFLIWTVKPWLRRWEQAINVKLFPKGDATRPGPKGASYFAKFDTSEYERSDYATMLKGIQTGAYAGCYALDERRKLLGLNPVTADNFAMTEAEFQEKKPGKSLWRPVNMAIEGQPPAVTAPGTSLGGDDPSADAPADDQPAPADDGGDDSGSFAANLDGFNRELLALSRIANPTSADFHRSFYPLFRHVAVVNSTGGVILAPMEKIVRDLVTQLKARGTAALQQDAKQVLAESIQAIALAAKAHEGEAQC